MGPANTNISASLFLPRLPLSVLLPLTRVSKEIQSSGPGASPFNLLEKRNLPSSSVLPLHSQSISEAPRLFSPRYLYIQLAINKVCGSLHSHTAPPWTVATSCNLQLQRAFLRLWSSFLLEQWLGVSKLAFSLQRENLSNLHCSRQTTGDFHCRKETRVWCTGNAKHWMSQRFYQSFIHSQVHIVGQAKDSRSRPLWIL